MECGIWRLLARFIFLVQYGCGGIGGDLRFRATAKGYTQISVKYAQEYH